MRITFSTDPMYDIREINEILRYYLQIQEHINNFKREIPRMGLGVYFSDIESARNAGLHHTTLGNAGIEELEEILDKIKKSKSLEEKTRK